VLKPGGKAIVMLYNGASFRRLVHIPLKRLLELASRPRRRVPFAERVRRHYDTNARGEPAPHTDYVTCRQAKRLFGMFSRVDVDIRNFDSYVLIPRLWALRRERLLDNLGRIVGLDLYITAEK